VNKPINLCYFFYFFIFSVFFILYFFFFFNLCCMVKKKVGSLVQTSDPAATVACMRESLTHACNSSRVINLPKEGKLKNLPGKAEGHGCFKGGLLDVHGVEELLGWCSCGVKAKMKVATG
jgi:hypothetical protein